MFIFVRIIANANNLREAKCVSHVVKDRIIRFATKNFTLNIHRYWKIKNHYEINLIFCASNMGNKQKNFFLKALSKEIGVWKIVFCKGSLIDATASRNKKNLMDDKRIKFIWIIFEDAINSDVGCQK